MAFACHAFAAGGPADRTGELLVVSPGRADLGDIQRGAGGTVEFTITSMDDQDIKLVYIYAQCDCSFVMPHSGVVPAWGEYILEAEYKFDEGEDGWWEEMITIITNHSHQQEINIPVTAFIHSDGGAGNQGILGGS